MTTLRTYADGVATPIDYGALIEASYAHLMQMSVVRIIPAMLAHAVVCAAAAAAGAGGRSGHGRLPTPSLSTVRRHFKALYEKHGWRHGFNPEPPPRAAALAGTGGPNVRGTPRIDLDAYRHVAEARNRQMGIDILASCEAIGGGA